MRVLLTHRCNLKRQFPGLENAIRHSLKSFGFRLGGAFARQVRRRDGRCARRVLWKEYYRLHDLVVKVVVSNGIQS